MKVLHSFVVFAVFHLSICKVVDYDDPFSDRLNDLHGERIRKSNRILQTLGTNLNPNQSQNNQTLNQTQQQNPVGQQ